MLPMLCVLATLAAEPSAGPAADAVPPAIPEADRALYVKHRRYLPDFSRGTLGVLGPLWWGRAMDVGEDARFADAEGRPDHAGDHLWLYGFNRVSSKGDRRGLNSTFIHARNNFVVRDPSVSFAIQPKRFLLNTTGAHNLKIVMGYTAEGFRFEHGDNTDLAHLTPAPRVVVFLPVRHRQLEPTADRTDQSIYHLSPIYHAQSPCVIEFEPGGMIQYEWFRGEGDLDGRVLYDLVPHFTGDHVLKPGVTHPIVQFDLGDTPGAWTLKIERDGRDGLTGGDDASGWDLVITHESEGAKPYTVDLDPDAAAWALSVFSPGGSPADTSEVLLGLRPYGRETGEPIEWPDRSPRHRTIPSTGKDVK